MDEVRMMPFSGDELANLEGRMRATLEAEREELQRLREKAAEKEQQIARLEATVLPLPASTSGTTPVIPVEVPQTPPKNGHAPVASASKKGAKPKSAAKSSKAPKAAVRSAPEEAAAAARALDERLLAQAGAAGPSGVPFEALRAGGAKVSATERQVRRSIDRLRSAGKLRKRGDRGKNVRWVAKK